MIQKLRIVHLEDSPADVELVLAYLRREGTDCEVTAVRKREEYEAALESGGFDLIFADYTLPSFDGMTALLLARQRYPDLPFIFVTGTLGETEAIEALKNGATDYVLKHTLSRLMPAIKRALLEREQKVKRREAEAQLVHAAQQWRTTFDSIADGISTHNMDYEIIKLNRPLADFLGRSISEVLGRKCYEVLHGLDKPIENCPMSQVLVTKKPEHMEFWDKRFDKWLSVSCFPIMDETGVVTGVTHVVKDITERKKAEDALKERVDELERFRKAAVDREFRIKELRDENEKLRRKVNGLEGRRQSDEKREEAGT